MNNRRLKTTRIVKLAGYSAALAAPVVGAWLSTQYFAPFCSITPDISTRAQIRNALIQSSNAAPMDCERRRPVRDIETLIRVFGDDRPAYDDAWHRPLWMHCRNGRFEVRSAGEDGQLDTEDDIAEDEYPWDPHAKPIIKQQPPRQDADGDGPDHTPD